MARGLCKHASCMHAHAHFQRKDLAARASLPLCMCAHACMHPYKPYAQPCTSMLICRLLICRLLQASDLQAS